MRPPEDGLERLARRAARRLTVQDALRSGLFAANAVTLGLAASALATLVVPLTAVPPRAAAAAAVTALGFVTVGVSLLRRVDLLAAARVVDARAGLLDRLSTAIEVRPRAERSPLAQMLFADAARHAASVNLGAALPWRIPRSWLVLPAALLFLFIWSAFFRGAVLPGTPAQRAREVIRQEGSRIERFAQSLQSRTRRERAPQTRRLAPQLRDLGERLQRDRLDRTEALARISELGRQVDQTRREVETRLRSQTQTRTEDRALPQELFRRQALQEQIRQLRELTTRLQQNPEAASQDALQRLGELGGEGGGDQPARMRENLQRAREQLQRGDAGGAGDSLTEALRELEGLDQLLSDAEGLRSAQQQLERSRKTIGDGGSRLSGEVADDQTAPQGTPGSPGENRPAPEPGGEARAPEGPYEGTTPGRGRVDEKLGAPTSRLNAQKKPERLRGAQSEGPAGSAEVLGAGRPGTARAPTAPVPASIVAQADRAMENAHTPGRYRGLVRRYFERLARLR